MTVPIVARPKPLQLVDTRVYVVNKDNYEQFVKQFTEENGELAYVALAIKDYENLALNIADIKRFIEQQNEIIVYYESAMQKEDKDATMPGKCAEPPAPATITPKPFFEADSANSNILFGVLCALTIEI